MSSETTEEKMFEMFSDFIEKHFGSQIPVVKQFQEEKMEAIEWLYPLDQEDLHGEQMNEEEIRKMIASLNKANEEGRLSANIGHVVNTSGWHLVKAWVNETDCWIGGHFVPEGWPLAKTKFTDKTLWEERKAGKLAGLSIGAKGVKVVEEQDD